MAKLPQLLDALTAADGRRERSTFDSISRAIRGDGLLPPSKRGHGATVLGVQDATNLLLAALVPVEQAEAATAAVQLRSLRRFPRPRWEGTGVLAALAEADTFGDAVDLVIERVDLVGAILMRWTDDAYGNMPAELRHKVFMPKLSLSISSNLTAEIAIDFNRGTGPEREFSLTYVRDLQQPSDFYAGPFARASDTTSTVSVGLPTLLRLHDALFPEGADG